MDREHNQASSAMTSDFTWYEDGSGRLSLSWELAHQVFVTRTQAERLMEAIKLLERRFSGDLGPLRQLLTGAAVRVAVGKLSNTCVKLQLVDHLLRKTAQNGDSGDVELKLRGPDGQPARLTNLSNSQPTESERQQVNISVQIQSPAAVVLRHKFNKVCCMCDNLG
jgi:hypothetical protein